MSLAIIPNEATEVLTSVNAFGFPARDIPTNNFDKAHALFQQGYRVALHSPGSHCLRMVKQDGSFYLLFPRMDKCTCAGFSHRGYCKHSEEGVWWGLLQLTATEWAMNGEIAKASGLCDFYMEFRAWQGRQGNG